MKTNRFALRSCFCHKPQSWHIKSKSAVCSRKRCSWPPGRPFHILSSGNCVPTIVLGPWTFFLHVCVLADTGVGQRSLFTSSSAKVPKCISQQKSKNFFSMQIVTCTPALFPLCRRGNFSVSIHHMHWTVRASMTVCEFGQGETQFWFSSCTKMRIQVRTAPRSQFAFWRQKGNNKKTTQSDLSFCSNKNELQNLHLQPNWCGKPTSSILV